MNMGIPNIQNVALRSWNGLVAFPRDVTNHNKFGWTFEVTADIVVDAVFKFQSAPGSLADPCVPGAFTDIPEVAICKTPAVGALTTVTFPAGTKAGTICAGTIPCRANKFIQMVAVSGNTANVFAMMVLQAPH
jgi:hypothetical protein